MRVVVSRSALLPFSVALAALLLTGCGQGPQQGGGFHGFPPAEVTLVTIEPRTLPVAFEYTGQAVGSKEVEVRARVGGILEERLFREGAVVQRGQPLFVIDPKPSEAQAAFAEAELARANAQLAQAKREAARLKPLAEKQAIGQKEYDDAVSNGELAAAAVASASAKLREARLALGYTRVLAPITGTTTRAAKSEGSLVTAGESLLTTIAQTDPIWIQYSVSENEKLRIERAVAEKKLAWPRDEAMEVVVKLADGTTLARRGRINFADTRINPATGTYENRAELPNRDGALRPGQFVRVVLKGPARQDGIALPQAAVLEGPQGKFVYIAGKDKDGKDVALPRPVVLGDWVAADGANLWLVESGLAAGDKVIVDGLMKLMPGAPIKLGGGGAQGAPGGTAPATDTKAPDAKAPAPDAKAPAGAANGAPK